MSFSSSRYDVLAGNAPDDFVTISFAFTSRLLSVMVWDLPIIYKLSYNGIDFLGEIEVDPLNMSLPLPPIPFQCKSIQVKNKVAGSVGRYQFIAYQ
jgi:hypothetical protein